VNIKESLAGDFERGKPWNPRKNEDDPNPLYAAAVKWSKGTTAHGEADFLSVRDDDGTLWSILVGTYRLRKELLEGELSEWDSERNAYAVVDVIGPVQPGELLAIEYRGERTYVNKEGRTVTSPDHRTLRRQPEGAAGMSAEPAAAAAASDDDIPF
jgi:hypothetical protein